MDFAREPKRAQGAQFSSDAAARAESASQQLLRRSKAMPSEIGRFQRADRILCTRDFTRALKAGKRETSKSFVVVITPKTAIAVGDFGEKRRRLGVTVSRRVGNAVIRNKVKRCIREWFRHTREGLLDGSDTVVIARRAARDLSGSETAEVLDRMIHRAEARRGDRTMTGFQ
jgi:ribonuclease P protein component